MSDSPITDQNPTSENNTSAAEVPAKVSAAPQEKQQNGEVPHAKDGAVRGRRPRYYRRPRHDDRKESSAENGNGEENNENGEEHQQERRHRGRGRGRGFRGRRRGFRGRRRSPVADEEGEKPEVAGDEQKQTEQEEGAAKERPRRVRRRRPRHVTEEGEERPKRELTEKEIERRRLKNRKRRAKKRERMQQLRRARDFNEDGTPKAPEFSDVKDLTPGTTGINLVVKVLNVNVVVEKEGRPARDGSPRTIRIADCLVGDATATVFLTARNKQIDLVQPGMTLIVRNANVRLFESNMRVTVGRWGKFVPYTEEDAFGRSDEFTVNEEVNVSDKRFKVVFED